LAGCCLLLLIAPAITGCDRDPAPPSNPSTPPPSAPTPPPPAPTTPPKALPGAAATPRAWGRVV